MNNFKPTTCWRSPFKPCCEIAATTGCNTNWCRNRLEAQVIRTPSPPYPVYLQLMQNLATEEAIAVEDGGSNESQSSQTGGIDSSELGHGGSQFNGRSTYPSQQQPVGNKKGILPLNFHLFFLPKLWKFPVFCHIPLVISSKVSA